MLFLIGIWKSLGFGARKVVECFKTIVLRTMWTVWTQFKRLQNIRILAAGVDAILMIFWQNIWLLFASVLKICWSLN